MKRLRVGNAVPRPACGRKRCGFRHGGALALGREVDDCCVSARRTWAERSGERFVIGCDGPVD